MKEAAEKQSDRVFPSSSLWGLEVGEKRLVKLFCVRVCEGVCLH